MESGGNHVAGSFEDVVWASVVARDFWSFGYFGLCFMDMRNAMKANDRMANQLGLRYLDSYIYKKFSKSKSKELGTSGLFLERS